MWLSVSIGARIHFPMPQGQELTAFLNMLRATAAPEGTSLDPAIQIMELLLEGSPLACSLSK